MPEGPRTFWQVRASQTKAHLNSREREELAWRTKLSDVAWEKAKCGLSGLSPWHKMSQPSLPGYGACRWALGEMVLRSSWGVTRDCALELE